MNNKRDCERAILSRYIGQIKQVGGRGPKNIHVKISGKQIHINYTLVFSPLENFVYENLDNSINLLTDLYRRVGNVMIERSISDISNDICQPVSYVDYKVDVQNNKFQIILEAENEIRFE